MKKRRKVALLLGINDPVIRDGIIEYAAAANWMLDDCYSYNHEIPRGSDYDGILTLLPYGAPHELRNHLMEAAVPVVDMTLEYPEIPAQRVIYDNFAIGRSGAEHLISCGFSRFFYYQITNAQVEKERFRGFAHAVKRINGELVHLNLAETGVDASRMTARMAVLTQALCKLKLPAGAMAQNDATLYEFLLCCQDNAITVPDDIGVVGADNDSLRSRLGLIPLSSVENNRAELGRTAAATLDRLMDGAPVSPPIKISPRGVAGRESTNVVAHDHPILSRALTFIKRNYAGNIHAGDVAQAAGVSRRGLFTVFKEKLHRSVADEIRDCRMRHARLRLREGDEKISVIAAECGFIHGAHLSRCFKQTEHMSCAEYRRACRKDDAGSIRKT